MEHKYTLDDLANFIAEFTKDGAEKKDVWEWFHWFNRLQIKKKKKNK